MTGLVEETLTAVFPRGSKTPAQLTVDGAASACAVGPGMVAEFRATFSDPAGQVVILAAAPQAAAEVPTEAPGTTALACRVPTTPGGEAAYR